MQFKAHAGSLGGVRAQEIANSNGQEVFVVADLALKGRRNMTTGANKDDFHLRGVDVERDLKIDKWDDFRTVQPGEVSPDGAGILSIYKSLEIGHIFKLGTKYSDSMGAQVLDKNGKPVPIVMGSYGIGVERILAAFIEQNYDENGIIFIPAISPFDVIITITNVRNDELNKTGELIYQKLMADGFDVLIDDRDERAGVKFKDADLIGIPFRVNVGKKNRRRYCGTFQSANARSGRNQCY